jgi:hypothetical protein
MLSNMVPVYNSRLHPLVNISGNKPFSINVDIRDPATLTRLPLTMVILPRQVPGMPALTPEYLAFNIAPKLLSVSGTLTALALFIFLLRAYVRTVMLRVFGADDALMLVAVVSRHFRLIISRYQ